MNKKIIIIAAVVGFLVALFFLGKLIGFIIANDIVRDEIQKKINRNTSIEAKLSIEDVSYNIFLSSMDIENIELNYVTEDSISTDYIYTKIPEIEVYGLNIFTYLFSSGIGLSEVKINISELRYSIEYKMLNYINEDQYKIKYKKDWTAKFIELLPDKLNPITINKLIFNITHFSKDEFAEGDNAVIDSLEVAHAEINNITIDKNLKNNSINFGNISFMISNYNKLFPTNYMSLKINKIRGNEEDNSIEFKDINYEPYVDQELIDERFEFREEQYDIKIDKVTIYNFKYDSLILNNSFIAGGIEAGKTNIIISSSTVKEENPEDSIIRMPNKLIRNIPYKIQFDSLKIHEGNLVYKEQHPVLSDPAVLEFTGFEFILKDFNTTAEENENTRITVAGSLADAGRLVTFISIPLTSKSFQVEYSGELGPMNLQPLNSFLRPAEFMEINSGFIFNTTFNVSIRDSIARGVINPSYENLSVTQVMLDPETEEYYTNLVETYLVNTMEINKRNVEGTEGYKQGDIEYFIEPDDSFFQTLWLPLKQGIGKVVGFE